jgi:rRNA-processing protein FCF1
VEGAFLQAALENQVMVREQITQMLQADCRLYITRCVLAELRAAGGFFAGAAQIASQFSVFTCSHGAENLPSRQCLLSACGSCIKF